jgi:hypothetical protein
MGLGITIVHPITQDTLIKTPNLLVNLLANLTNHIIKTIVAMTSNLQMGLNITTYTIEP